MNQIQIAILPVASANTALALSSELYNIESNNTIELRSQSVATATGNEHTVLKTANESVIATKVRAGEIALLDTSATNQRQEPAMLARVLYL
ncbi:hypothetical protein R9X47_04015 [Wukongibacter baidiensis]|uniref:hypothetical protein n=1 Tax=Wukongibacter baidiensis TaxID=1723361 RepID=UPI003D7FCEBC